MRWVALLVCLGCGSRPLPPEPPPTSPEPAPLEPVPASPDIAPAAPVPDEPTAPEVPTAPTSQPPEVVSVTFPPYIPSDGSNFTGTVTFRDDTDLKHASFDLVKGDFSPFAFDPRTSEYQRNASSGMGSFTFFMFCKKSQTVTLRLTLLDTTEVKSAARDFSVDCR